MMLAALSLAGFFVSRVHGSVYAQATFDNNEDAPFGPSGYLRVLLGHLYFDMDFVNVNFTELGLPETCADEGMQYHMHTAWNHDGETDQAFTTNCSEEFTARRFDPWLACSPLSDNDDCEALGGCVPPGTTWREGRYDCNSSNYNLVPYVCDLGDWSGKYGNVVPGANGNITEEFVSFWELGYEYLALSPNSRDTSLVMSCGSGEVAFCAVFLRDNDPFTPNPLEGDQEITTYLWDEDDVDSVFEDFHVVITADGYLWRVPQSMAYVDGMCKLYQLTMWEGWNADGIRATTGDACEDHLTKGVWDPTHQCMSLSSSPYCSYNASNGEQLRCPDEDSQSVIDYSCDEYFCSVGDLSGRMGEVDLNDCVTDYNNSVLVEVNGTLYCEFQNTDDLSAPLYALGGRSLLLTCLETGEIVYGDKICAATIQTAGTVVTDSPIVNDPTTTPPTPTTPTEDVDAVATAPIWIAALLALVSALL